MADMVFSKSRARDYEDFDTRGVAVVPGSIGEMLRWIFEVKCCSRSSNSSPPLADPWFCAVQVCTEPRPLGREHLGPTAVRDPCKASGLKSALVPSPLIVHA